MNAQLIEIRRQPEKRSFHLAWSDGHVAELAYDTARGYCPCAGCQGHGSGKIVFHPPARSVEPETIEAVGNYAVHIVWSDQHATGIYRFDFLRELATS